MEYGAYFGLFLILKFLISTQSIQSALMNLIAYILTFALPFILFFIMRHYKRSNYDGIRVPQLWSLGIMLFFFASLLSGLAAYIYYQYIDPALLDTQYQLSIKAIEFFQKDTPTDTIKSVLQLMKETGAPTPMQMVLQTIWVNVFFGTFLSAILALIANRTKRIVS